MVIIGEKINATRKSIADAIEKRDAETIAGVAREQDAAGADVIDVNAGSSKGSLAASIDDMKWLVNVVQGATNKPLAVDSENPEILAAGLETVRGATPWINSISAEPDRLEHVIPLMKKYRSPAIALCMDQNGIPRDEEGRLKAADTIYHAARQNDIEAGMLYFDPLVMPIGTDKNAGKIILNTISEIKKRFPGAKTVAGLSNVSFGLPQREIINATYLTLCMGAGLDAAIADPTNPRMMMILRAADALLGNDEYCMKYIREHRKHK